MPVLPTNSRRDGFREDAKTIILEILTVLFIYNAFIKATATPAFVVNTNAFDAETMISAANASVFATETLVNAFD